MTLDVQGRVVHSALKSAGVRNPIASDYFVKYGTGGDSTAGLEWLVYEYARLVHLNSAVECIQFHCIESSIDSGSGGRIFHSGSGGNRGGIKLGSVPDIKLPEGSVVRKASSSSSRSKRSKTDNQVAGSASSSSCSVRHQSSLLRIPQPLTVGTTSRGINFICMEKINFSFSSRGEGQSLGQQCLGYALKTLHELDYPDSEVAAKMTTDIGTRMEHLMTTMGKVGKIDTTGKLDTMGTSTMGAYASKTSDKIKNLHNLYNPHFPIGRAFGFPMDGCCGSAVQRNASHQTNNYQTSKNLNWVDFCREYGLEEKSKRNQIRSQQDDQLLQELGMQLSKRLPELFSGAGLIVEDIKPSLLHGDLWSGNVGMVVGEEGHPTPSIFDPACYYGHSEADLGIAHMFGGFSPAFWDAYHSPSIQHSGSGRGSSTYGGGNTIGISKAPGFERRALLYELHHHLNHHQIFGKGYREGCLGLMRRILG